MKAHMARHVHRLSNKLLIKRTRESVALYGISENIICDGHSLHLVVSMVDDS
jgi:hypothetical protein